MEGSSRIHRQDLPAERRRYSTTDIPTSAGIDGRVEQVRRITDETRPRSFTSRGRSQQTRDDIIRSYEARLQAQVAARYPTEMINRDRVPNGAMAQSPPVMHFPQNAEQAMLLPLQPPLARAGSRENPLVHDQQIAMLRAAREGRNQAEDVNVRGIRRVVRGIKAFLGLGVGNRHRKELVSLVWTASFGFVQVAFCIAFVAFSAVKNSPTTPQFTEWKACDKPLGIWSCLWIFKVGFDCCMSYWNYKREWKIRQREESRLSNAVDLERGTAARGRSTNSIRELDGLNDSERRRRELAALPYSKAYHRLSLLLSFVTIAWFLTANVLVFSSLQTCRFDAPHIWWLAFSLLCIQYFVIVQVLLVVVLIFVIGPLIFLFWNIFLLLLGRHPMQNPNFIQPDIGKLSKAVVNAIPLVMYIPTPPGEEKGKEEVKEGSIKQPESAHLQGTGPEHTYPPKSPNASKGRFEFIRHMSSRPTLRSETSNSKNDDGRPDEWEDCWEKGEFPFVRLTENRATCAICLLDFEEPKRRVPREVIQSWATKNRQGTQKEEQKQKEEVQKEEIVEEKREEEKQLEEEEKQPEEGEKQLEGGEKQGGEKQEGEDPTLVPNNDQAGPSTDAPEPIQEVREVPIATSSDQQDLKLEDAGEGAQPLRLLDCGHVFHKTCVDPWLTDVSGRCPTCQRPVARPPAKKSRR